jgi:hypothetical protein
MRCSPILLDTKSGGRVHVFGYESDLERTELLYTSLLLQMASALQAASAPGGGRPLFMEGGRLKAWNRSFLLGFSSMVTYRLRKAEERAVGEAKKEDETTGRPSTELVLADRSLAVQAQLRKEYPNTRMTRITSSGRGYGAGQTAGRTADIGGTRVSSRTGKALSR